MLWRGETQEGIDGSTTLVVVGRQHGHVVGTRPCRRPRSHARASFGRFGAEAGNVRRAGTPKGAPIATWGTPWRAKPRDAPALCAPGGSVVEAAKEVSKPHTWHAAAGGPVVNQAAPPIRDCVVGHQSPGEAALQDESVGRPSGRRSRRCGAGLQGHVFVEARKCMGGRRSASAGRTARKMTTRRAPERRTGRAGTSTCPGLPGLYPRSTTQPHERPRELPRGGFSSSSNPYTSEAHQRFRGLGQIGRASCRERV